MTYRLAPPSEKGTLMVVGCGGTGAFVAEGLCRLFPGREIILIDHDRVEERNLGRQSFYEEDMGRFKAQALAERLARQYRREIEYHTAGIDKLPYYWRGAVTIGCVDNAAARRRLEIAGVKSMGGYCYSYQDFGGWYIDAGNGEYTGQVLIGNSLLRELYAPNRDKCFYTGSGECKKLPLPTVQQPALLAPPPVPVRRNACARDVELDEQSPVINRMMADLVLVFVHKLLKGTLTWMAAYIDMETGAMNAVEATPERVARMTGLSIRQLEHRPRKEKQ